MATTAPSTRVVTTAVLPVIKTRTVPVTPTLKAVPALGALNARPFRIAPKIAKNVVLDGPRLPIPGPATQAITYAELLVVGADVATGRVSAARRVPGRSAGATPSFVTRLEMATTGTPTGTRRGQLPVRAANAGRARPLVAKTMAKLEIGLLQNEVTTVVTAILPTATPEQLPVKPNVAATVAEVAVAMARREELNATRRLVRLTVVLIHTQDHAVAYPDEVGAPAGPVQVPVRRD